MRRSFEPLILAVTALLFIVAAGKAVVFARADTTPFLTDESIHLFNALDYLDHIRTGNLSSVLNAYHFYPPLTYLAFDAWAMGFGISKLSITLFNMSVIGLGLVGVWFLGLGNTVLMLLSAYVLLSLRPATLIYPWAFMLEIPSAVMILSAVSLMTAAVMRRDTRQRTVLLAALLSGASLLIKWSALIFLITPVGWFVRSLPGNKRLLFFLLSGALLLWYPIHWPTLFRDLSTYAITIGLRREDLLGWRGVVFYLDYILRSSPIVIVLLVALLVWKPKIPKIVWWILGIPLAVAMLLPNKDERFLFPFLIVFVAAFSFFLARSSARKAMGLSLLVGLYVFIRLLFFYPAPETRIFAIDKIPKESNQWYFFEDPSPYFNPFNVRLSARLNAIPYYQVNQNTFFEPGTTGVTCDFPSQPFTLVVFSSPPRRYPDRFVTPAVYCKNFTDIVCQEKSRETSQAGEVLSVNRCVKP